MKSMKKIFYFFIVFGLILSFSACKKGGGIKGKYYEYEGLTKIEESWFELQNKNRWIDNNGVEGRYEVKKEKITLYSELLGEEEELMSGTIKNGVLTFTLLGTTTIYKKDGAIGSGDDQPFYVDKKDYFAEENKTYSLSHLSISNGMVKKTDISTFTEELYLRVPYNTNSIKLSDYIKSSKRWDLCEDKEGKNQISDTVLSINLGQRKVYYVFLPEESKSIKLVIERKSTFLVSYYDQNGKFLITHHYLTNKSLSVPDFDYKPSVGYSSYKWAYLDDNTYKTIDDPLRFMAQDGLKVKIYPMPDKYNITLDPDGGNISYLEKSILYNSSFELPVPNKQGYVFLGWYLNDVQYTDNYGVSLLLWNVNENATLKAIYKPNINMVSITKNNNQAGIISIFDQQTEGMYDYDSLVTVKAVTTDNPILKDEYSFIGWFNGDICISTDKEYTFKMPAHDVILEARWDIKKYSITYHLNGGINNPENPNFYTVEDEVVLKDPIKLENTFVGWYDNPDFEGELYFSIPKNSSGNKVFYASWLSSDEATFGLHYELYDDGYYVSKGTQQEQNIIIPEFYCGKPVVGILEYGFSDCSFSSINLPSTIKFIGKYAFSNCVNLTSIYIPNSIEIIEFGTFNGCKNLTEITMPFVGESIDATNEHSLFGYVFGNKYYEGSYSAKQNYTYDNYNVYYLPNSLKTVTVTGGDFKYGCFSNCLSLETINIPESVEEINDFTFKGTTNLKYLNVDIKNQKYTDIDGVLFDKSKTILLCYPLGKTGSYEMPLGVLEIGSFAFKNNTNLNSIILPNTLVNIGESAFFECINLALISMPSSLKEIGAYAFYGCEMLNSIILNEGLKKIDAYAFMNCRSLTIFTVPNSVISIGDSVFGGCSGLIEITLPFVGSGGSSSKNSSLFGYIFGTNSYENSYAAKQFYYYDPAYSQNYYATYYLPSYLKTVRITGGKINYGSFFNCTNVENIVLYGVNEIDDYAFAYCKNIKEIVLPNSITKIGYNIFYSCSNIESITLPFLDKKVRELFNAITVTSVTRVIITGGTYIPESAFLGITNLTSVVIPSTVTSIGLEAFRDCGKLKEITLPFIGTSKDGKEEKALFGYIFGYSSYAGSVATNQYYKDSNTLTYYIPESLTTVTITGGTINYGAFSNCDNLITINLPQNIISIADKAFYNCSKLTNLNVPQSVTSIGTDAFYGCNSLKYEIYNENLKYLGNWLIDTVDTTLNEVKFKENTIGIYNNAFSQCINITSITIPESITYIGKGAFYGCKGLTEITLTFIGATRSGSYNYLGHIFGASTYTENATYVPKSLSMVRIISENIVTNAFYDCNNIKSIYVFNGVKKIEKGAFVGCSSLEKITLPFIGESINATNEKSLFGYIFGITNYTGSTATEQYYTNGGKVIYYIPTSLKTVTINGASIGYGAFYNCNNLTTISIPEEITIINDYAFYNANNLLSIIIPETVLTIGKFAFANCSKLMSVEFEENSELTSIGESAFQNCSSLVNVNLPKSLIDIKESAFYGCSGLTSINISNGIREIKNNTFYGATSLAIVIIEEDSILTTIGKLAFYNCKNLEVINLPDSVIDIADDAFNNCSKIIYEIYNGNLKYLGKWLFGTVDKEISEAVLEEDTIGIYYSAFKNCNELTSVTIPKELRFIMKNAFYGCTNLSIVKFPIDIEIEYIGSYAFAYCSKLSSLTIPQNVKKIGSNILEGCSNLRKLELPFVGESVDAEGTNALFGYLFGTNSYSNSQSTLQYYTFNSGVTYYVPKGLEEVEITGKELKYGAFYNCDMIKNIKFDNIISIGNYAFYNCTGLEKVIIPESTSKIGSSAFSNCHNLINVYINKTTPPTMSDAFLFETKGMYIYVPSESLMQYKVSAGWIRYANIIYAQDIIDENNFAIENGTLISYFGDLTDVIIPNNVIKIGAYAFKKEIKTVIIPSSVIEIENYAFYDCTELKSINFLENSSLVLIGDLAFYKCINLTEIVIPSSVTAIGRDAFSNCNNLKNVIFANGSNLSTIGYQAFYNCMSIESIVIPESVTNIDSRAFSACINLKSIFVKSQTPPTIANDSFRTDLDVNFFVPSSSFEVYLEANVWKNLTNMYPEEIINENGFAIKDNVLIQYQGTNKDIRIPDNVSVIGEYAFDNNINSVIIPASVTLIKDYAFKDCNTLISVIFEEESQLEKIGSYAFSGCSSLEIISVPSTVKTIDTHAFSGCESLNQITLPFVGREVDSTGSDALFGYIFGTSSNSLSTKITQQYDASGSVTYYIPSGLKKVIVTGGIINYGAFSNCKMIEEINLSNITNIKTYAFSGCNNLKTINIPSGVKEISDYAFADCINLGEIVFPLSVTIINKYAFTNCSSLASINIPSGVTEIKEQAFSYCTNLASVIFNSTTPPALGLNVFVNNSSGRYFYVPSTQLSTYKAAVGFISYSSLIYSKTIINTSGFAIQNNKLIQYTGNLIEIVIPSTVTIIGNFAFNNKITKIEIPASVATIEDYALRDYQSIKEIVVSENNNNFSSIDGVLYDKTGTILVYYPVAKENTYYVIPDGVTTISKYGFKGSKNLIDIYMPLTLTTIDEYAFMNCSNLLSITIPSSVTSIKEGIFSSCENLTELTLPFIGKNKTTGQVLGILFSSSYFNGGVQIQQKSGALIATRYLPGNLKKITVNGGIISYGTFYNCTMLSEIVLNGISQIDEDAFYNCINFKLTIGDSTPPLLNQNGLYKSTSFSIYVPKASLYTYKNSNVWINYANVIYGY